MSAADEKEQQRRRFEDAQTRVVSAGRGQASTPGSAEPGGSGTPPPVPIGSTGYMTAAEEKEQQRRRFESAQDRVVSGGVRDTAPPSTHPDSGALLNGRSTHNDDPVPYESIFPSATSSNAGPSQDSPSTLMNGTLMKREQMKRYYEAQDKVSQAKDQPPTLAAASTSPPPVTSPPLTSRPVSVAPVNEKEQMRRYYEAMERVQRASGGGPASSPAPVPLVSPMEPSPKQPLPSTSPHENKIGFMSAADEKAAMQRRFNDAQAAVNRNPTPTPQSQPTTASSIGHQRTVSSMSSAPSPSPPDSPLVRDPTVRAGKAKAMGPMSPTLSFSDGPSPPLPARPPSDYINLLSPVRELGSPWGNVLGGTGGGEGTSGK